MSRVPCLKGKPRRLTKVSEIVLDLGKVVKESVAKLNMLPWQYNTIGVSDAITMGNEGMRNFSGH